MMILTNITLLLYFHTILITTFYLPYRAPRNLRRCGRRARSGSNANGDNSNATGGALSPQEVEIALVESSLRNMMANMSTMMEAQAWGGGLGTLNAGDRREYIANVLMTKVRIRIRIHVLLQFASLPENPSS
jgi:hypothetical protein